MATVLKRGRISWRRVSAFALLTLILPMLLAACGGTSATSTPAPTKAATNGSGDDGSDSVSRYHRSGRLSGNGRQADSQHDGRCDDSPGGEHDGGSDDDSEHGRGSAWYSADEAGRWRHIAHALLAGPDDPQRPSLAGWQ